MLEYRALKEANPGALVFLKCGDFYEAFDDDAREAAKLLRITITRRGGVPMAGFAYHQQGEISKVLSAAGRLAVIADLVRP